jgi:hypothetical protein
VTWYLDEYSYVAIVNIAQSKLHDVTLSTTKALDWESWEQSGYTEALTTHHIEVRAGRIWKK